MVFFPFWAVIVLLGIAAAGVLALLHAMASSVRNDRRVHDLRIEAVNLRANYQARLQQIAEDAGIDVDLIAD